jgi:hypothetical protein
MTNYTFPESEAVYCGDYPNMAEFHKPWESCIEVLRADGKFSNGKPIISEGFAECFGLILRNRSNTDSVLFHFDNPRLNRKQCSAVEDFMRSYLNSLHIKETERKELISAMEHIVGYENPPGNSRLDREGFRARMKQLNNEKIIQAKFAYGDCSHDEKKELLTVY